MRWMLDVLKKIEMWYLCYVLYGASMSLKVNHI